MRRTLVLLLLTATVAMPGPAQTIVLGTGTLHNDPTSYPAPYGNYYKGARHQVLVRAAADAPA